MTKKQYTIELDHGLGAWNPKIFLKNQTYCISIERKLAQCLALKRGQKVQGYNAYDDNGREVLILFLDGCRFDGSPSEKESDTSKTKRWK